MTSHMAQRKTESGAKRLLPAGLVSLAAALVLAGAVHAQTITKCQDAEGNWHYGDFAAEVCDEQSTITEIDERGLKVDETDAPPTQDELDARKTEDDRESQEAERLARQVAEDQRLLQTYDSDEAIIRARDQRVTALEQELESHRMFRQALVDEKQDTPVETNEQRAADLNEQIEQYDTAIQRLEEQRREVIEEYDQELERYRKLTD
jgi:predicted RNase H-like nuclease (RuvC/YqgF family)